MINDYLFVYIIKLQNSMLLAEKKINQILEIVKIMQQERSGGFLVLLSIDTDIPPVDCRFLLLLFFSFFFAFAFLCLLLFVFYLFFVFVLPFLFVLLFILIYSFFFIELG
jgi:hypothetical protein